MGKFKKFIFIALSAVFVFSFAGCTRNDPDAKNPTDTTIGNTTDGTSSDKNNSEIKQPDGDDNSEVKQPDGDDNSEIKQPDGDDNSEVKQPEQKETLGFADVGDKYLEAVKPLYDMAGYILEDLVANDCLTLPDEDCNPRITSLRYFNPTNFEIQYCYDLYIGDSVVKSEFLEQEMGVDLVNFTGSNESHDKFYDFLKYERQHESSSDYVEKVLPMAQEVANAILSDYETYKADRQIKTSIHSKKIILRANSSLSEVHHQIIDKINQTLPLILDNPYRFENNGESVFPLVDYSRDIEISFAGNIYETPAISKISVTVYFQNFYYTFYNMPFNSDGEFTKEYISHMQGSPSLGYWSSETKNPTNEEYIELFEKLKVEEMNFPLGYSEEPNNYFYTLCNENTFLYFE